ncbi:MAG: MarR family winged helix-turn-helix transcriptional regulator [Desulfovibrio sp.]
MSSSFEQSPCSLAGALARLHVQALQARLAPHKATAAQFPVLQCLWERDGQTQSELCRSLSVEQPTLANTLGRMVRDNLVRKVKDTNDRRQVIIRLTKRGRELENVLSGSVNEVLAVAQQGLSQELIALYLELTRQMIANLRQELEQAPVVLDESLAVEHRGVAADSTTASPPLHSAVPLNTADKMLDTAEEDVLVLGEEYVLDS